METRSPLPTLPAGQGAIQKEEVTQRWLEERLTALSSSSLHSGGEGSILFDLALPGPNPFFVIFFLREESNAVLILRAVLRAAGCSGTCIPCMKLPSVGWG